MPIEQISQRGPQRGFGSGRLRGCAGPPNGRALKGTISVPGDKSISHRALLLGASAIGKTLIEGLLEGEDVLATAHALEQMGVPITRSGDGAWSVLGRGVGGLSAPAGAIDCGNSGTGVRLLMGLLSGQNFTTTFVGDASLSARPMGRVLNPLRLMGAQVMAAEGDRLPVTLKGPETAMAISYRLPVASAQVKSAVLLAGLNAPGETRVIEPTPTRDHTENMLRAFGAQVHVEDKDGLREVVLTGQPELMGQHVKVPGDPSSAAFLSVAALICPGSDIRIRNVLVNPLRAGLYMTLQEMGGDIVFENQRSEAGEAVADLHIRSSQLTGIEVPPERAASMIDEYPVLMIAALQAKGVTRMRGLEELRVKESDRIAAMARGFDQLGLSYTEYEDGLDIPGGQSVSRDGLIETLLDHRIAMSFLTLGLASDMPVTIDDGTVINTSFPGFIDLVGSLGGHIEEV